MFIFADDFSEVRDTITDFQDGIDRLNFIKVTGVSDTSDLTITDMTVEGISGVSIISASDEVFLQGVTAADIDNSDFLFGMG